MKPSKGYYCLIQYCPDPTRLEAATIGVLLFCPERAFLKALTARDNRRIRRFFGREGHDLKRIDSFKAAIQERVEVEQPAIQKLEDLEKFIGLRANRIQITPPRTMRVYEPKKDLEKLFKEIVGGEHRGGRRRSFPRYVGERLMKAGLRKKLKTHIEVVVPVFNKQVEVPYGFQNGRFNLIQPVRFEAANPDQSLTTACRYAVEGRSLFESQHPQLGPLKLVVVGKFRAKDTQTRADVRRVLTGSQVDLYGTSQLSDLIHEIRTTGKDFPDEADD
jgi:hypothetical protein